jgi:hypothetical protein
MPPMNSATGIETQLRTPASISTPAPSLAKG